MRGAVVGSAVALVCVVVACGSSDGGGGNPTNDAGAPEGGGSSSGATSSSGGSTSGGITTPCGAYANALCGWLFRCIPNEVRPVYATLDVCSTRETLECERTATLKGAAPMDLACPAELETTGCAQPIAFKVPIVLPTTACDLRGTVPDEGDCERDRQCQSGYCEGAFVSAGTIACGRCRQPKALNAECDSGERCALGLACDLDGVCRAPHPKDSACKSRECARPLRCVDAKCVDPLPSGAPCTKPVASEDPCDAGAGLECREWSCQTAIFSSLGADCTSGPRCDGAFACVQSKCVARAADGQPCTELECTPPAVCAQSACTILPPSNTCL